MTSDAVLHWVRALTLPSVLFTSALAGHAAGNGAIPSTSALVPLFVLTVVAVGPFTWVPIRPARAVVLLLVGQGLLHAALQMLGRTTVAATTAICDMGAGAAPVSAPTNCHLMTHLGAATSHGSALSLMGGGHLVMLLAHLAAASSSGWRQGSGLSGQCFDWLHDRSSTRGEQSWARPAEASATWWSAADGFSSDGACGVRSAVRWVADVVSRRGPPGASSPDRYAYGAVSTV